MKVTGMTAKSANTSVMHQKKKELHRKTMLKVMDPNVHQLTLSKNHATDDDSDDGPYDGQSSLTQPTRPTLSTLEPKIEMKRKIARQSDLIVSLEK